MGRNAGRKKTRSGRAHRRYTTSESAALDEIRKDVSGNGVPSLLSFLNHSGPWHELWSGIERQRIAGEPFHDWAAVELQNDLRRQLQNIHAGRPPFSGPTEITLTYRASNEPRRGGSWGVHAHVSGDDLSDFLQWALLEAVRTGAIERLRLCQQCGRAFMAKRKPRACPAPVCQQMLVTARRQRRKVAGREAQRVWAKKHLGSRRSV